MTPGSAISQSCTAVRETLGGHGIHHQIGGLSQGGPGAMGDDGGDAPGW